MPDTERATAICGASAGQKAAVFPVEQSQPAGPKRSTGHFKYYLLNNNCDHRFVIILMTVFFVSRVHGELH